MLFNYPPAYFIMLIVGLLMVTSGGMANAFLPIQAQKIDPSGLLVGLVVSSYHSVRLLFELPSGVISDTVGRKKLILFGLAIGAGGALVCASTTSIYALILGRALWGFGAAFFFLNNTTLIVTMFEPSVRGKALGLFQSLEIIGSIVGQPLGAFAAEFFGYSATYYLSATMIIVGIIPILISKDFSKRASTSLERSGKGRRLDIRKMVRNPYLLIICATVFIRMIVNRGIAGTTLEIYLVNYLAMSLGLVGIALMIRSAGLSVTTIGSGFFIDKFGSRFTIILGTLLEAIATALYSVTRSFEMLVPVVLLEGLGSGMLSISLMVILSHQVDPSQTGSAVGFYRTFQDAGSVTGPIVMVTLYESSHDISATFYLGALLLLVNIPLLLKLPKKDTGVKVSKEGISEAERR